MRGDGNGLRWVGFDGRLDGYDRGLDARKPRLDGDDLWLDAGK